MIDLKLYESEAADAERLIIDGTAQQWRASILADVIEPGGLRFRLFVAHDDDHAKQPARAGAPERCHREHVMHAARRCAIGVVPNLGRAGNAEGPESESYSARVLREPARPSRPAIRRRPVLGSGTLEKLPMPMNTAES
jgi:hypothetical protein